MFLDSVSTFVARWSRVLRNIVRGLCESRVSDSRLACSLVSVTICLIIREFARLSKVCTSFVAIDRFAVTIAAFSQFIRPSLLVALRRVCLVVSYRTEGDCPRGFYPSDVMCKPGEVEKYPAWEGSDLSGLC